MAVFLYKLEHFFCAGFKGNRRSSPRVDTSSRLPGVFREPCYPNDGFHKTTGPAFIDHIHDWLDCYGKWVGKSTYISSSWQLFISRIRWFLWFSCYVNIQSSHGSVMRYDFYHQRFHVPIMEESSPKAYVRENPFAKKNTCTVPPFWLRETFGDFRVKCHDFKYDTK